MNIIAVVLMFGALFSSESLLSVQGAWRNLVPGRAIWKDSGNSWSVFVPPNSDIWHFGPTRLWTRPLNTDHYEITSRVLTAAKKVFGDCGHMFKYKVGSTRTRNFVTKAWGYFMWSDQYLYITSNGKENSPQIQYKYLPNQWYDLKTVVKGAVVKIYINNQLVQQITMTGEGATSKTNNFVGLWCHSNTNDTGSDFRVKILSGGDNNQVNCTSNHMQIAIPKSSLPYVLSEDLRLNDPSCGPTEDQKNFYFETAFDQCGTKVTSTSSVITYSNEIQGRQLLANNNTVISRIPRTINLTFSCSYPRAKVLSSPNVQPNNSKYIAAFHSHGQLHFNLKLFPTDQFSTPYNKYPISVHLRQLIYIEVSVRSIRKELSILAHQCYATPTSDSVAPKHWLIKNSCPVDRTLKALPSPTTNVQRFRVQAFRFVGNHKHFYIHCVLIACNGNDVSSMCARGCKEKKLGKRSDEVHSFKVIQGPITVREPK